MSHRSLAGRLLELGKTIAVSEYVLEVEFDGQSFDKLDIVHSIVDDLNPLEITQSEAVIVSVAWAEAYARHRYNPGIEGRTLMLATFEMEYALRNEALLDSLVEKSVLTRTSTPFSSDRTDEYRFTREFEEAIKHFDVYGYVPKPRTFLSVEEQRDEFISIGDRCRTDEDLMGSGAKQHGLMNRYMAIERRSPSTALTNLLARHSLKEPEYVAIAILASAERDTTMMSCTDLRITMGGQRIRGANRGDNPTEALLLSKGLIRQINDEFMRMTDPAVILTDEIRTVLGLGANSNESQELSEFVKEGQYFTLIYPNAGLDAVVTNSDTRRLLKRSTDRFIRNAAATLREWGIQDSGYGNADIDRLVLLLYGPPGTGKTMSAYAIAHDLGKQVLTADVSSFLDPWVGMSEKKLRSLFARFRMISTKHTNPPVMVLNEADAMLNQRIQANRAVDQMANNIVAILLEELERFRGVLILTVNDITRMDQAFSRRIDVKVFIDRPSAEGRAQIWRQYLPSVVPGADLLDLDLIAKRYELTGGQITLIIRNACIDLALRAPEERLLTMDIIQEYIRLEVDGQFEREAASRPIGFMT